MGAARLVLPFRARWSWESVCGSSRGERWRERETFNEGTIRRGTCAWETHAR